MQNKINVSSVPKTADMLLFYAERCLHSAIAKWEWDVLKDEFTGKTINGYKMNFVEYNCSRPGETDNFIMFVISANHVKGFPTIKLIKDKQVFTHDPTKASLEQFLQLTLIDG